MNMVNYFCLRNVFNQEPTFFGDNIQNGLLQDQI